MSAAVELLHGPLDGRYVVLPDEAREYQIARLRRPVPVDGLLLMLGTYVRRDVVAEWQGWT